MARATPAWAIDLGTTNTGVSRWDSSNDRPRLVELPRICRKPGGDDPLQAPRMVPSATDVLANPGFWANLGASGPLARRFFLGKLAVIGRPAVEANEGTRRPSYAPSFKAYLGRGSLRPLASAGGRDYTARDVARLYVRELFAEVKATTGERIRDLVVTTPVESYENYRAEIVRIGEILGVRRLRFLDEPVAAAIGYGLGLRDERRVMVVDFGGGTCHVALVSLTAHGMEAGSCQVLGKEGRATGGDTVDRWLLEEFCRSLDYTFAEEPENDDEAFWRRLMIAEARRVKEALYFQPAETFYLTPPEEMRRFEARLRGEPRPLEVKRERLGEILEARGLYKMLEACVAGVLAQAAKSDGGGDARVDEVLMVGGSTLLPGIYALFERRFGRDRVRAWQPFEAVAYGASAFAAGRIVQADFIVHDYAFITYDLRTHQPQYTVIVPRGTRFPTGGDFWKRQLVPTCPLGEPERIFKLVVCEIGRDVEGEHRLGFDASGQVHRLDGHGAVGEKSQLVVPLNETNPALGYLDPPQSPSDKHPRLEIGFGVNGDRWLIATVQDLRTKKILMRQEPVWRLL